MLAKDLPLSQFPLQLVLTGPKSFKQVTVTVADKSEAIRAIYFYNRLYICETFITWLNARANVFKHVNEEARAELAEAFARVFNEDRKASLDYMCELILLNQRVIKLLAPKEDSDYYKKYAKEIIPIVTFCQSMKGVPRAC
ncbi:MAG: hypothetical protein JWQ54_2758 [Mucilaginibacter sp.]|nr:hypothetical protein [Mucilaginibacter sp.]